VHFSEDMKGVCKGSFGYGANKGMRWNGSHVIYGMSCVLGWQ
jgi:hypothetical protein